jgi:hypothetical protein
MSGKACNLLKQRILQGLICFVRSDQPKADTIVKNTRISLPFSDITDHPDVNDRHIFSVSDSLWGGRSGHQGITDPPLPVPGNMPGLKANGILANWILS